MRSSAGIAAGKAARVTACTKYVQGYTHDTSTVAERVEYAGCVWILHPQPLPPEEAIAFKAAIVFVLVCAVIGAVRGIGDFGVQTIGGRALGALGWAAIAAVSVMCIVLAVVGVRYVFS